MEPNNNECKGAAYDRMIRMFFLSAAGFVQSGGCPIAVNSTVEVPPR